MALWINTYSYLLETAPQDTLFVSFEKLCSEPKQVIDMLFSKADIAGDDFSIREKIKDPKIKQADNIEQNLQEQAFQTYRDLSERIQSEKVH